mmetsp:Transcript_17158/g.12267  ORF Transcript_17158/g.12267 Transcript_17158/m.12267 type:complete len:148 (+) Transcript_17158:227-670(+)|eukprot:CAMPEP_0202980388 /NCGR_PEP_ID=MMETSP1396-20130829/86324_1 /ASSEMBLY_ACC=CAM_ASM_000872 /TAXON_ID= /ORGANISM="Pseudokeronopsis sp., Strain Brazil" /LENGTH=147 /DNA_ID=CAMNT_0049720335 /DNA_START=645 /DNA_END=1088 /DNA_ORIENTATION=-
MSYLNQLKSRMEKQEETNNAAMLGGDFIKEEDEEYTSDSELGDLPNGVRRKNSSKRSNQDENQKSRDSQGLMTQKELKKRIAELIQSKVFGVNESGEILSAKLREMQDILKMKSMVKEGITTYRVTEGAIEYVDESQGNLLINKSVE